MSTIAICQPNFLPWLGYFEMSDRADVFVMLDDVQYVRREWVNRNRIPNRSEQGWGWLSVPLVKAARGTLIRDMQIDHDKDWANSMLGSLRTTYSRAPFFENYELELATILKKPWPRLVDLNLAIIRYLAERLGVRANLMCSSELGVEGRRDDKLAAICSELGATRYLANNGSMTYIEPEKFAKRGIEFEFQDYQHPNYAVRGYSFQPFMSVVDALFWHGPDAHRIVLEGRPQASKRRSDQAKARPVSAGTPT